MSASAVAALCEFLTDHIQQLLVINTAGNPFLIGRPVFVDDCVVTVQEEAGYVTFIPLEEIVEIHTVVGGE